MTWIQVVLGSTLGLGLVFIGMWTRARKPTLVARISPFVRTGLADEIERRDTTMTPLPALERLLAPVVRDIGRLIGQWGSPSADVARRLRRAGSDATVEQFRAQQVAWGAGGLGVGIGVALLAMAVRDAPLLAALALVVVATALGVLGRDMWLTRTVKQHERRLLAELPTIAELLALSVTAGESALGALERVSRTTSGALASELGQALADARAGVRLPDALTRMAQDTGVPALERFAEGVATAIERGTPLADVLRAQAQDARSQGRQALVEEGGKREIAMMVPVVFLILPVTVIFAIFPGLIAIQLGP